MFQPSGALERFDESVPAATLFRQDFAAGARQLIVAAPALSRSFDPMPGNQAFPFEAVEHRVQRGDLKRDCAFGPTLDLDTDFVAVAGAAFELGQDEQLGGSFFAGVVVGSEEWHMYHSYIYHTRGRGGSQKSEGRSQELKAGSQ